MSDCGCPVKQLPVVIVTPQEEISVTVCPEVLEPVVVVEKEIVLATAEIMVPGIQGAKGDPGKDGKDGKSATVSVGSVTTGRAGSSASVVNSGTELNAVLDFVIPQGERGDQGKAGPQGIQGEKGEKGDTPELNPIPISYINNLFGN